jgi:hypothetical protein
MQYAVLFSKYLTYLFRSRYIFLPFTASTALTPNTHVIHAPTEGEVYKKYQVPAYLQVVEKETMDNSGTWEVDYVSDAMRRRFAVGLGFSSPDVGEMQMSKELHSQTEALLRGGVSGSMTTVREDYTLSFQQDWGADVVSDVLGSGIKTKPSDEELREQMLRDGGISDTTDSDDDDDNNNNNNNFGPATKIAELLLDMVCGPKLAENITDDPSKVSLSPLVPDCLLTESNVVLDDDFSRMQADKIFKPRKKLEASNSEVGEAKYCTAQDIIDGSTILREMGSHIIVGVTVGGSVQATVDLNSKSLNNNDEMVERNVEESLKHVIERAEQQEIISQMYYETKDNSDSMSGSDVLKSRSISTNPRMRQSIANDPIASVKKWEAEEVEDRSRSSNDVDQDDENDGATKELNALFKKNGFDPNSPYKKMYPKYYVKPNKKKNRRRRLLLSADKEEDKEEDKRINGHFKPTEEDYEVQDTVRRINGGSYFPRSFTAPSETDLSIFWETVEQQPGFLKFQFRPLLDVITHTDVLLRCFGENLVNKRTDDYHKTKTGRKLLRRQVFWENFLLYMNIKIESLELSRQKFEVEQKLVQTGTFTKMEMVRRFQKFANKIDKTASGSGNMLTLVGSWTRLSGLIRESKDNSDLLDMISSITGVILTHSRLLTHSRSMCRAGSEYFRRKAFIRGQVEKDVPLSEPSHGEGEGEENVRTEDDTNNKKANTNDVKKSFLELSDFDVPSLQFESKFIIGASYALEKECIENTLKQQKKLFESAIYAVTIEQYALKGLMETLWSLSLDYAVQLLMNELRIDREFITSNRGLNNGRKSSTAALCQKEKGKAEMEICFMMESIVRQTIVEHLDVSSSNLALDPTVELSRLINELMLVEPLLYKYRKNKNPKTNKEWSRLEKANSIAFILFGSRIRKNGFVSENNKLTKQEIINDGSSSKTKATYDLRNLIGELSKSEDEMDISTVNENINEMLKSTDESECSTFSSLRAQYGAYKKDHDNAINNQQCSVCEYYINLNRVYGRSNLYVWRDDVSLWPTDNVPSDDSEKGSGPKDVLSKKEITNTGDIIDSLCDRQYFKNGDGLTSLDHAEKKCGGSPFDFIDGNAKKRSSGGGGGGTAFLETPLDVALAISDPKGGAMLGLTSTQKRIITEMNQKRLKQTVLPKTCEGVSLQPGQMKQIQIQFDCIELELKGVQMKASTTKKQCESTVKDLKPMLINQLKAFSRASGSPTIILGK